MSILDLQKCVTLFLVSEKFAKLQLMNDKTDTKKPILPNDFALFFQIAQLLAKADTPIFFSVSLTTQI